MAESPGTIGKFEILGEIGRGGMGVVYEARDPLLDRTVALKVIQPAPAGSGGQAYEERFLAEARAAAALEHPGIVVVHELGRDPATGAMFIAMQLLRGQTLADLAAAGPVGWRLVLSLVAQVARALHHAHRHGVVHRDVKPANVLVLPTGEAKIMDFGIARLESARLRFTTTGAFVGTPLYTAPEQAKIEEVDGRADVFSLASVAYTLLAGRPAFLAPTIPGIVHRVVYEEPEPLSRLVDDLPPDVERVLVRALAKDPARRHPTALAFAEDAEDVLAGQPPRHAAGDDLVVVEGSDPALAGVLGEPSRASEGRRAKTSASPAEGPTRTAFPAAVPRRGPTPGRALAAGAVLALLALFLWMPRRPADRSPSPAPPAPEGTPAPGSRDEGSSILRLPGPLTALLPQEPARLGIDFDHPLRSGTLRVFVDDELALEERIRGQQKKKALVFKLHEGSLRNELDVAPGLHEVRVEVRWDDNVRAESIVGNFTSGTTRRLDASLGRIRRDLKLEWN